MENCITNYGEREFKKAFPFLGMGTGIKKCVLEILECQEYKFLFWSPFPTIGNDIYFSFFMKTRMIFFILNKKIILNDKLGTVFFLLIEKIFPKF